MLGPQSVEHTPEKEKDAWPWVRQMEESREGSKIQGKAV